MRAFLPLVCAMLVLPAVPAAAQCGTPAPAATVDVRHVAGRALLHYSLARPVPCYRLVEAGKVRQLTWKVLTPGASLAADGNAVLLAAPAASFHVEIAPFARDGQLDRVYSPLIAFGDGSAVAVYNRYLAGSGARTRMRFDGFAPLGGSARVGRHSLDYDGADTYLVAGTPAVSEHGAAAIVIDRSTPPWLAQQAAASLQRAAAELAQRFSMPRRLAYLLTYTDAQREGAEWRGDTSTQMVRLNLMGALWQQQDSALAADLRRFIYHELFHTVNHDSKAAALGEGGLSLLEGGAEAAAQGMRHAFGELDAAAYRAVKDAALMRCLSIGGATLADKERYNTRAAPYACGETLQYLAAALRADGDVLPVWQKTLRTSGYGWQHFLAALDADPQQAALLDALAGSKTSFAEALDGFARAQVLRPLTADEQREGGVSAYHARLALNHVLGQHCKAQRGTYFREGIYTLDAPPASCSGLPDKFPVAAINGHRLREDGRAAHQELAGRCAQGSAATLEDLAGKPVTFTCSKPLAAAVLYRFQR